MKYYNHYVTVVKEGTMIPKTWRNPDKFPEDKEKALEWAKKFGGYAVEIKELVNKED